MRDPNDTENTNKTGRSAPRFGVDETPHYPRVAPKDRTVQLALRELIRNCQGSTQPYLSDLKDLLGPGDYRIFERAHNAGFVRYRKLKDPRKMASAASLAYDAAVAEFEASITGHVRALEQLDETDFYWNPEGKHRELEALEKAYQAQPQRSREIGAMWEHVPEDDAYLFRETTVLPLLFEERRFRLFSPAEFIGSTEAEQLNGRLEAVALALLAHIEGRELPE